MNRRRLLTSTAGAAGAALAGCLGLAGGATGTLATRISDQPGDIDDFESCIVTIDAVEVRPATGDGVPDGGIVSVDAGGATADLVDLQGDRSALVAKSDLAVGEYEWLRLLIDGVDATLTDGSDAAVTTPGAAPLKFNESFEIRADTTTTFTADFTPVKQGQSGGYVLQPVADEVTVTYSDEPTATGTES